MNILKAVAISFQFFLDSTLMFTNLNIFHFRGLMPPKKKLTKEETLLRKSLRERERYERIKNDPAKYELQKEKERRKYKNKKKKRQVKSVKQWRKNYLQYLKNKKLKERFVLPDSPVDSDESNSNDIQQNVASKQKISGRKQIRRDRSKVIQRNKRLLTENSRLQTKLEGYKIRYYRLANPSKKSETPRTKVRTLMQSKDKETVRRRLLFGVALEHQLKSNYKAIDSKN